MLKIFPGLIAAIIATPLVAFGAYDLLEFQPHMGKIRGLIAKAAPDEQTPPDTLVRVVRVAQPEPGLSGHVARQLLSQLDAAPKTGGQGRWHLISALWWALVSLHFTESERLTLFLELSYMGPTGQGYDKAANAIVGCALDKVTLEQAAILVSVGRAPYYLEDASRLNSQSARLLERVKNAH